MTSRGPLLVVLAAAAALSPCLWASFHFDDHSLFTDPVIAASSGWWEVFRMERTRPLTYLTFWLNVQTAGREPFNFHLVNLLLHLATVWISWGVFRRLAGERVALAAMLIFAVHPVQTEAVTYVFARATLLATGLCLLCWKAWLDDKYAAAVAYFALALLAKEEAAAFPVFLLGAEFFNKKRSLKNAAVLRTPLVLMGALVAAAAGRLAYAAEVTERAGVGFSLASLSPAEFALTQPRVIWEYLRLVVWPIGLNFDRDFPLSTGFDAVTIAAWGALALAAVAALSYARKAEAAYWAIGFLILILPTSSIVPLADVFAERRVYLPMLSLSLAAGVVLKRRTRFLLPLLALVLGVLGFQRAQVWRTEETLWRDTVEKSPAKARPKLQLARALEPGGPDTRAERLALLQQARRLQLHGTEAATELGVFYLRTGRAADARREFRAVLDAAPNNSQALANYGAALYVLGNLEAARDSFSGALSSDPCNFDARNNALLLEAATDRRAAREMLYPAPDHCRFTPEQEALLESNRHAGPPSP